MCVSMYVCTLHMTHVLWRGIYMYTLWPASVEARACEQHLYSTDGRFFGVDAMCNQNVNDEGAQQRDIDRQKLAEKKRATVGHTPIHTHSVCVCGHVCVCVW
jgi:hypothetical protein